MNKITCCESYHVRIQTQGGWTAPGAHLGLDDARPYLTLKLDSRYVMIPLHHIIAVELIQS